MQHMKTDASPAPVAALHAESLSNGSMHEGEGEGKAQTNGHENGSSAADGATNGANGADTPSTDANGRPKRGRKKKEVEDLGSEDMWKPRTRKRTAKEVEEKNDPRKKQVSAAHTLPYNVSTALTLLQDYPEVVKEAINAEGAQTNSIEEEDESSKKTLEWRTECPVEGLEGFRSIIDKTLEKEGKRDELYWANDHDRWTKGTYINADVRYLNLSALGKFDVVLIDPPWRIRGNEASMDGKTMFNNSKFTLEYNTLSNQEIIDIDVGCLSDSGFLFMWIINSQLQFAFECMNKWGYTYADKITWVKKTKNHNISIAQGYYFLHSTEMCLIGIKGKCEFISKVSNDVIFAETREKSQKPDQMYHIIERMCPGGRKIEVFARNHNLRKGWLSLGNELGEYYDWDHDKISCDVCGKVIELGKPRYKSKQIANRDLCEGCLKASGEPEQDYFFIENIADTMIFHQYYECNGCKTKPLWGMRFHCLDCEDCDLCEACYDAKTIPADSTHLTTHNFQVFEMPELAGGLPVHRDRCAGCLTFPIIGFRFKCHDCPYVNLCQKCFFNKKTPKTHDLDHDVELIIDPVDSALIPAKCDACSLNPIVGNRYKCNSCYNYDLCETCYFNKAPPPLNDTSHKPNHKFTCIPPPTKA